MQALSDETQHWRKTGVPVWGSRPLCPPRSRVYGTGGDLETLSRCPCRFYLPGSGGGNGSVSGTTRTCVVNLKGTRVPLG